MSDIIDLAQRFKEKTKTELKEYAEQQYKALVSATSKIKELEDEVAHLKALLVSSVPMLVEDDVQKIIKLPEEVVIETQIAILQNRALQGRELTLEEVKTLDLLIKNKKLLSGEATTIVQDRKPKKSYSEAELVHIASQPKKLNE